MDTAEKKNCCGCGACAAVCHLNCITMEKDEEGFLYPHREESACVHCGMCDKVCPMQREAAEKKFDTEAYVLYRSDENKRRQGSSGGVFSALAAAMLESGAAVGGVAMDDDAYGASWLLADDATKLEALYGSKYIQADICQAYRELRALVSQGKGALVSGTPCQIEALKKYPGLNTEKLFFVDVVCHGAPSPQVFRKYVEEQEKKEQSKVTSVFFRDKHLGWRNFSLKLKFENDKESSQSQRGNSFMKLFLRDRILRPSCYYCQFRNLNYSGDVTLADCWGVRGLCQDLDDDKGLSLVLVNTERGQEMITELMEKRVLLGRKMLLSQAVKANANLTTQPALTRERSACFADMDRCTMEELAEKYAKVSWKDRLKGKIKNVLRRL